VRNWRPQAQSFNGVRLHFIERYYYFADGFATIPDETAGDVVLWGFYGGLDRAQGPNNSFDLYAVARTWTGLGEDDPAGATEVTLGLRDNSVKFDPVDYNGDVAVQLGERSGGDGRARSVVAYHANLEVGVTPGGVGQGPVRVAAEVVVASVDNPDTRGEEDFEAPYANRHSVLGLADRILRTDLVGGALRLGVRASQGTRLELALWSFWRARTPEGGDKHIGWELDLGLNQSLLGPFGLRAEYSLFADGSDPEHSVRLHIGVELP
jgi:hypothetical protein